MDFNSDLMKFDQPQASKRRSMFVHLEIVIHLHGRLLRKAAADRDRCLSLPSRSIITPSSSPKIPLTHPTPRSFYGFAVRTERVPNKRYSRPLSAFMATIP